MTTKEKFLREKIKNFIIFIKEEIGEENNIYREFSKYQTDLKIFLQAIVKISSLKIDKEMVLEYLKMNDIKITLKESSFNKLMRYLQMFIQVVNS
jgi:hypothetical protein